jgi:hypothetical protein
LAFSYLENIPGDMIVASVPEKRCKNPTEYPKNARHASGATTSAFGLWRQYTTRCMEYVPSARSDSRHVEIQKNEYCNWICISMTQMIAYEPD